MPVTRRFLQQTLAGSALLAATAIAGAPSGLLPEVERASRTVSAADLGSHLRILASDEMEGRGLETSGNDRAAGDIADALARVAVPAFLDQGDARAAYFQNFALFDASLGPGAAIEYSQAGTNVVNFPRARISIPRHFLGSRIGNGGDCTRRTAEGTHPGRGSRARGSPARRTRRSSRSPPPSKRRGRGRLDGRVARADRSGMACRSGAEPNAHNGEIADVPVACVTRRRPNGCGNRAQPER